VEDWLQRSQILLSRLPIKDRENHTAVPFRFYPSQVRRLNLMREQWRTQGHIRIIDLKSRRVGFSSQTTALFTCRGLGFPNMNMKVVAHLTVSAEELFRVPSDLMKGFPGFPVEDIQSKRIYFRHADGDSHLTIATAGTPAAGRGGTLSALLLSEAASYTDDEIFTAMISSVSKGPGSIIVIESTANGREGPGEAFSEYWDEAVAGRNGYIYNFASWLEDPAFIRAEEEAEDAPADDLEKELMAPPFNATREQIAWMRRTKADDCRNIESKFLQDFPHCPEVAFQISGSPAFPRDELAYAETTVKPALCRGRFIRTGGVTGQFKFVREDNGPWHIWKFPFDANMRSDGYKYYAGADAALGMDEGDFAAISVLCGQTGELAARFAERVPPEQLADQMDMVGRYYNMAMVNPELTGNLGRWALIKLRDVFRYPNIYFWKGRDDKKRGKNKSLALGFDMTQAARRLIIDACRSGLRMGIRGEAGALIVNDRALMSQISLCTLKEWRWEVRRDHDDILVSWMIACLTREQYPPNRMSFAPKNIMEETPKEKMQGLNVRQEKSEIEAQILREMSQMRRRSGLDAGMRGTGKKAARDRLIGV
jgi:hypothetical protein